MLDWQTYKICKENRLIKDLKIKNLKNAIDQAELIIKESKMNQEELNFLKRKISDSRKDVKVLC